MFARIPFNFGLPKICLQVISRSIRKTKSCKYCGILFWKNVTCYSQSRCKKRTIEIVIISCGSTWLDGKFLWNEIFMFPQNAVSHETISKAERRCSTISRKRLIKFSNIFNSRYLFNSLGGGSLVGQIAWLTNELYKSPRRSQWCFQNRTQDLLLRSRPWIIDFWKYYKNNNFV